VSDDEAVKRLLLGEAKAVDALSRAAADPSLAEALRQTLRDQLEANQREVAWMRRWLSDVYAS
jgi:hypothetical protein